jgi:hypothetical protein
MTARWFWFILTIAVMVWYSTITIYVGIRGAFDVRQMLRDLGKKDERG